MESYFEFNVALNGHHLFATAPRSFPTLSRERAKVFYSELCARFPESEGFTVSVTELVCLGYSRTIEFVKEIADNG